MISLDRLGRYRPLKRQFALWTLFIPLAVLSCSQEPTVLVDDSGLAVRVDTTADLSKLRYPDGQLTLNDQCPVRRVRLNTRMPAIYVNQHPVGFC